MHKQESFSFLFRQVATQLAHQVPPCGIGEMANMGKAQKKNTVIGVLFFVAPPVGLEPTT